MTRALCRAGLFCSKSGSSSSFVTSPVSSSTSTLAGNATYPPRERIKEEKFDSPIETKKVEEEIRRGKEERERERERKRKRKRKREEGRRR